jgi:hypothetical protein
LDKEEMNNKFNEYVNYLKKNIPPDDIYMFAEETFMATLFFLHKWSEWVDVKEECKKDPVAKKWVNNIVGLQICKDLKLDVNVNLDLKSIEEE